LGVALVGYGHWGPNLARSLEGVDGAELRAISVRSDAAAAAVAEERPGIFVTTDLDAMLERPEVDVVGVVTPAPTHPALAARALRADKHVLVEKPLATDLRQAEELVALAAQRGRTLMVGYVYLYHPAVRRLGELLRAGKLGELVCVTSERANPTATPKDGGVLWNLAPHDLSIVVHLFGDDVRRVEARRAGDEELVFLTLELGSGALVQVAVSWVTHAKPRRMIFTGSEGIAVFDENAVAPLAVFGRRGDAPPSPLDVELPAGIEPLRAQWEELVAAVRERRPPLTGAGHALAVQRLLDAAERSLRPGP